jgi:hypothetical protein
MTLLAFLTGCESIGEGSTLRSLEILPASGSTETSPSYQIYQCLRDQLVVLGTFTDGTRADFSFRATWTSEHPSIVQVSNNDIPTTVVVDGAFVPIESSPYRPGTLVPKGAPGAETTITASFVGITASIKVSIAQPAFRIAPLKSGAGLATPQPTAFVGVNMSQPFGFFVQQGSRTVLSTTLNALGLLNPVVWRLKDGVFVDNDPDDPNDFDKHAVPSAGSPTMVISSGTGTVTGKAVEGTERTVEAHTSLCENDAAFVPTAPVRVAPLVASDPITLDYEPNFNGEGQTPTGDIVSGTSQVLQVRANLDTDDDGAGDETLDLAGQVDFAITPAICEPGTDTNCTCDTATTPNCTKQLFSMGGAFGNQIFTLVTNDGTTATVRACFTSVDADHADDCQELDEGEAGFTTAELSVQAVPVDLTATGGGSFQIRPASPAPEPAFTYPGRQFDAYGTFNALSGFTFAGGSSGTQKITRGVTWSTRVHDSKETLSDIAQVRNTRDGFLNEVGKVAYFKEVTTPTTVDISIAPASPFEAIPAPTTPVLFTVCPSSGC